MNGKLALAGVLVLLTGCGSQRAAKEPPLAENAAAMDRAIQARGTELEAMAEASAEQNADAAMADGANDFAESRTDANRTAAAPGNLR